MPTLVAGERLGSYEIVSPLGAGGMGEVYRAHDSKLAREVAIKVLPRELAQHADSLARFEREAKVLASLNHPNIAQIYGLEESNNGRALVMELIAGETLASVLKAGAVPVETALRYAMQIADALEAAHEKGITHRDFKPANAMITPAGAVKVLDFGLAAVAPPPAAEDSDPFNSPTIADQPTRVGTILGTPAYMAPEQAVGRTADRRADVWSFGVVLFEMLTGQRLFSGQGAAAIAEVIHARIDLARLPRETPAGIRALLERCLDRDVWNRLQWIGEARIAIGKCLPHTSVPARRATRRAPRQNGRASGATQRGEQAHEPAADSGTRPVEAGAIKRLIILPFRVLRGDADTDFLAVSLPDAIAASLAGLRSLIVRSTLIAARLAGDAPDLAKIAKEADVDVVLTGTLMRSGSQLRLTTQLVSAPEGTLIWSKSSQVELQDIFQLQDILVSGVTESLALPLSSAEQRQLSRDAPASPQAYDLYLRANELSRKQDGIAAAIELYEQCVAADPAYAPAWAGLGRTLHVMAKYGATGTREGLGRAEAAFRRALELNPDLPLAHKLFAQLEVDLGRARDAMIRLSGQAHSADPELLAGLVSACRYCGLLDASVAAHERALSLDPRIRTSVAHTWFLQGDYSRVANMKLAEAPYIVAVALLASGRGDEALPVLREMEQATRTRMRDFMTAARTLIEGNAAESAAAVGRITASDLRDPEAFFYLTRHLAHLNEVKPALQLFERVVAGGYCCYPAMASDPWLDPLRNEPEFTELLRQAETRHREASAAFAQVRGKSALGVASV